MPVRQVGRIKWPDRGMTRRHWGNADPLSIPGIFYTVDRHEEVAQLVKVLQVTLWRVTTMEWGDAELSTGWLISVTFCRWRYV
jgi:hypothetical protein